MSTITQLLFWVKQFEANLWFLYKKKHWRIKDWKVLVCWHWVILKLVDLSSWNVEAVLVLKGNKGWRTNP